MLTSNRAHLLTLIISTFSTSAASTIDFDSNVPSETAQRSVTLSGTLHHPRLASIKRMTWRHENGAGGTIIPGAKWQAGAVPLQPGDNHIVIGVWDNTGRSEQDSIHVFRTSEDSQPTGSGILELPGASVPYRVYGDTLVAAGCIELGSAKDWLGSKNRTSPFALANPLAGQRWTGNTIRYALDTSMTAALRETFAKAIVHWESLTPIRFVVRGNQANYLNVTRTENPINTAGGIGMVGGEQVMRLRDDATLVTHIHEIGHTVGLYHEQNRVDRHRFVTIDYKNVRKDEFRQVDLFGPAAQAIGGYDPQSVMHYDKTTVTRTGQRILDTIPAGLDVTSDDGLSSADVDAVQRMYGQTRNRTLVASNPPGLTLIVDGTPVTAPATFEWTPGSRHTLEAPAGQGSGATTDRFARWSNDGTRMQPVTASAELTSFTAHYLRHCKLTLLPPVDPALGSYSIRPYAADGYYPCDSEVTLTAETAEGVKFLDWTGSVGATNPRTFRVFRAYEIRPNFTRGQTITFRADPPGLFARVNGLNYFTPRTFTARDGSVFNVEAPNLNSGTLRYRFGKWSQGGAATQTIRVTGASSSDYTVSYEPLHYVSGRVIPAGGGTVALSPASADGFYAAGSSVEFRAAPLQGRAFRGWSGDPVSGSPATVSLRVDEQRYAEANFRALEAAAIIRFSPERLTAGSEPPILFVTGSGFIEALSQVFLNNRRREATITGFNDLYVQLGPEDLEAPGNLTVRVTTPGVAEAATGTRTLPVAAAPGGCSVNLGSTQVSAAAGFGAFAVPVTAGAGCPWYPVSRAGWLSTVGSPTGAGDGALSVWASPNPGVQPRKGEIRVAGQSIEVTQEGSACDFAAVAVNEFPVGGGAGPLRIRAFNNECAWTIASPAGWLQVSGAAAGTGSGDVTLTAAANEAGPREAVLELGKTKVSVRQSGVTGWVVNDANELTALAPGSRFLIRREGLAEAEATAEMGAAWPTELGGVRVLFGETPARLRSVGGGLIAGQVPSGVAGEVTVTVQRGGEPILSRTVTIGETAPAIYPGALLVAAGDLISLRLTGAGAADSAITDGEAAPADPLARPAAAVSATLNGADAPVESALMAPGEVGVTEVRVRVPTEAGPGDKALVVRVTGVDASPVIVSVR